MEYGDDNIVRLGNVALQLAHGCINPATHAVSAHRTFADFFTNYYGNSVSLAFFVNLALNRKKRPPDGAAATINLA